jgi:hypothetical protein
LFERKADLVKMITQLEHIGAGLPEALRVCNEVFKDELAEVTAEFAQFGPSQIGPIAPDSHWRRPMSLEDKLAMCGFWALLIAGCVAVFMFEPTPSPKCPRLYELLAAVAELVFSVAYVAWDGLFQPYPEPTPPETPVIPDHPPRSATMELYIMMELVAHLNYGAIVVMHNMLM